MSSSFKQKKAHTLATRKRTKKRRSPDDDDADADEVAATHAAAKRPRAEQLQPQSRPAAPCRADVRPPKSFWPVEDEPTSKADVVEMRKSLGILVRGERVGECPPPVVSADAHGVPTEFAQALKALGEPTPVQAQAWPALLAGLDVLCLAETGSGKTLAFVLPIAARVRHTADLTGRVKGPNPRALLVAPTRELASQTAAVCRRVCKLFGVRSQLVHGGVPRAEQLEALGGGCDVLVGTPGRLLDLSGPPAPAADKKAEQRRKEDLLAPLSLARVEALVLDEVDKLLAAGFAEQVDEIAARSPGSAKRHRLTALFSSTMPGKLLETATRWTSDALFIRARGAHDAPRAGAAGAAAAGRAPAAEPTALPVLAPSVSQAVQVTAEHKKGRKLLTFLQRLRAEETERGARNKARVLVFTNKVKTTEAVVELLRRHQHPCVAIHGERRQQEREAALTAFRSGKVPVLVATDVAGRGLDIARLPHVVNYDFPPSLEAFVNRVGRTGRGGAEGHALSFFTRNLAKLAPDLVAMLERAGQPVESYLREVARAVATGPAGEADAALDRVEEAAGLAADADADAAQPASTKCDDAAINK